MPPKHQTGSSSSPDASIGSSAVHGETALHRSDAPLDTTIREPSRTVRTDRHQVEHPAANRKMSPGKTKHVVQSGSDFSENEKIDAFLRSVMERQIAADTVKEAQAVLSPRRVIKIACDDSIGPCVVELGTKLQDGF